VISPSAPSSAGDYLGCGPHSPLTLGQNTVPETQKAETAALPVLDPLAIEGRKRMSFGSRAIVVWV
jgi:hypothetical protein